MTTVLTRRYRFSAVHVLSRSDWPQERNREVYGKCANPAGHGHDYGLEITVTGPIDRVTGRIFDPEEKRESTVGIREATKRMFDDPDFITTLVPIRDGMIIAYKR